MGWIERTVEAEIRRQRRRLWVARAAVAIPMILLALGYALAIWGAR